jgi:hypothetical protein
MILIGENRRTRRKTCPSATLSTTNATWTALDAKSGLSGEKPALAMARRIRLIYDALLRPEVIQCRITCDEMNNESEEM